MSYFSSSFQEFWRNQSYIHSPLSIQKGKNFLQTWSAQLVDDFPEVDWNFAWAGDSTGETEQNLRPMLQYLAAFDFDSISESLSSWVPENLSTSNSILIIKDLLYYEAACQLSENQYCLRYEENLSQRLSKSSSGFRQRLQLLAFSTQRTELANLLLALPEGLRSTSQYSIGRLLLAAGRSREASDSFLKLTSQKSENNRRKAFRALATLASDQMNGLDPDKECEYWSACLDVGDKRELTDIYGYSRALIREEYFNDASNLLDDLYQQPNGRILAVLGKAHLAIAQSDRDQALDLLKKEIFQQGNDLKLSIMAAKLNATIGEVAEAQLLLEQSSSLLLNSKNPIRRSSLVQIDSLFYQVSVAMNPKDQAHQNSYVNNLSSASKANVLVVGFGGIGLKLGGVKPEEFQDLFKELPVDLRFYVDPHRLYFLKGVPGIAEGPDDLENHLRHIVEDCHHNSVRVVFFGASAGGTAAINFGLRVGADEVLAFSPATCLQKGLREHFIDPRAARLRYLLPRLDSLEATHQHQDLRKALEIADNSQHQCRVSIFSSGNKFDYNHARYLAHHPLVNAWILKREGHNSLGWLHQSFHDGLLDLFSTVVQGEDVVNSVNHSLCDAIALHLDHEYSEKYQALSL